MVRENKDLTVQQAQAIIDENKSINEQEFMPEEPSEPEE